MKQFHSTRWIALAISSAFLAMVLFSCRREVPLPPLAQEQLNFSRIVDLSHIITQDMPTHPGALAPALNGASPNGSRDMLALSTRSGSRITAAGQERDSSVEYLAADHLVVPAVAIDLREVVADKAQAISADAIYAWEDDHGPIPPDAIVLLATGWDMRWSTPGAYMNLDAQQRIQVPGIDDSAVALLRERGVAGVGIDSPQLIADGSTAPSEAHWLVLEDLTNLEQISPRGTTLVVGALRLQGSAASPARIFAFVP